MKNCQRILASWKWNKIWGHLLKSTHQDNVLFIVMTTEQSHWALLYNIFAIRVVDVGSRLTYCGSLGRTILSSNPNFWLFIQWMTGVKTFQRCKTLTQIHVHVQKGKRFKIMSNLSLSWLSIRSPFQYLNVNAYGALTYLIIIRGWHWVEFYIGKPKFFFRWLVMSKTLT